VRPNLRKQATQEAAKRQPRTTLTGLARRGPPPRKRRLPNDERALTVAHEGNGGVETCHPHAVQRAEAALRSAGTAPAAHGHRGHPRVTARASGTRPRYSASTRAIRM